MSYDDFCRLSYEEFATIYKAYAAQRDFEYRDRWQRMRLLATIVIQPHLSKTISPEELLPFPWDNDEAEQPREEEELTNQQRRERMRELVERLGDKLITE